jgi:hypothetical protein
METHSWKLAVKLIHENSFMKLIHETLAWNPFTNSFMRVIHESRS